MTAPRVLVVGAGVAGLRCGLALADAGLEVRVLEAAEHAGGRAASWTDAVTGLAVDTGPHVIGSEYRNFLALLERLGTVGLVAWQREPLITLHDAGGRLPMPRVDWPPPLHGLPLLPGALQRLSAADLLSHRRLAWQAACIDEDGLRELDAEDALAWLRGHGVRPRAIDWFWRSALVALLNVRLEQCSAAAAMRVSRLMLGRSGWHFGFPRTALADLFVPAAQRALSVAGSSLHCDARVEALLWDQGRVAGVVLADGRQLQADQVVLALPPPALARLLAQAPQAALQRLATRAGYFRPAPYCSTYVWFDRPIGRERFWARAWSPQGLNTDFYDLSCIRPALHGAASVVACNAIGPQAREDWPDERIVAGTLEEIALCVPAARQARVLHARVHRTPLAIPQPRPGSEALRPSVDTGVPGLWLAGDWIATALPCSMESAARAGALAAEAVLAQVGRPRRLALPPPETGGAVAWLRGWAGAPPRLQPG